jgi:DNA-binding response OmpR family regulator
MERKKILIIDDDPDILITLKKRLGTQGYECVTVDTVDGGLKQLRELIPDLVVLDLGFPGPNGTAFLENVRNYLPEGLNAPPILVLSCHNDRSVIDFVLSEGAAGFLSKPYDPAALTSTIRGLLETH